MSTSGSAMRVVYFVDTENRMMVVVIISCDEDRCAISRLRKC